MEEAYYLVQKKASSNNTQLPSRDAFPLLPGLPLKSEQPLIDK